MIDLHSHSTCSDGSFAPARLFEEAHSRGVTTLALTDHDTVAGLDEAEAAAKRLGIEFVPGVEFTVTCADSEVHLLGLGIDRRNPALVALCGEIQVRRRRRFFDMVDKLRAAGVPLKTDDVQDGVSLARPYLARMLVEQGHASGHQDAFQKYLRKGGVAFVAHRVTPISRAIEAIHSAGGAAIVAHPALYRNGDEVVNAAVELGADGIECYHSDHNHDVQNHYLARARKQKLLVSGGADFHGPDHARSHMFGKRSCPLDEYERVMDALAARAQK
ncbi:MAG: PHP domain-containing protein [Planctomycetes bacterium]|nr:PHP domain-containing protein [Planctomycetota bacterium]